MSAVAPNVPRPLPDGVLRDDDFLARIDPEDLVYFLLNVGDGDLQLFLLPARADGTRRAIVVDVGRSGKLPALLETLRGTPLFPAVPADGHLFPLVVGTHPHDDHISGMPEFLRRFGENVREYWEPGYWHTTRGVPADDAVPRGLRPARPAHAADERYDAVRRPREGRRPLAGGRAAAPLRHLRRRPQRRVDLAEARVSRVARRAARRAAALPGLRGKTQHFLLAPTRSSRRGHTSSPTSRRSTRGRGRVAEALEQALGPDALAGGGVQGAASRLEARAQPRARRGRVAEPLARLVRRRRRQVQLPAHGRAGGAAGRPRGDDAQGDAALAGPRARDPLHGGARRPRGRSGRSRSSSRRPGASASCGASATGLATTSRSPAPVASWAETQRRPRGRGLRRPFAKGSLG